ncbi:response regulator [Stackebrandtia nassauensis]|uniref:Two component transcriptional regulator, LuxR family n=1 Tax=Stackebrandtia nassauensis (strain DSM 44728 / CIP 108903 / NRRL B-16338 / NBRC 102104 / LLR-40K-21) TaxID=446470 RepID=D3PYN4_STANL|nr:response regulator transcription factor [Stackebrandtia nassauensis]ADD43467.1 two component transcriptional regulator, LuxR family [Stackebrandtia nassauensis DSM 44728]
MKVFIVDDHVVVRAGLAALINGEADMTVVGEASDSAGAVRGIAESAPDIVLMDLQLGEGPDGVATIETVLAAPAPPAILVLTTYDSDADVVRAVEAGARGYLLKAGPPEELFTAIRAAARGEPVLSPAVADSMMRHLRQPRTTLTSREVEILRALARGDSNRAIAKRLFITEATVKTHLVHIYAKLDVDSRTAAVAAALERRLIRL